MSSRIVLPDEAALTEATERLRGGELVAFPTETVYGLGANALDAVAVAKIYAAKGRPATNPIIVHVASVEQAKALAKTWPSIADELAAAHWPGPLTLVLEKADGIPDIVTAGGTTVGIRIPNHPVALELLRRAGVPIAAPSANRSEEVSPTQARHVADSLGAFVKDLLILDGGDCKVGIESTVLDVTCDPPRVLRPGMVSRQDLTVLLPQIIAGPTEESIARSPGQMLRHYAPQKTLVVLVSGGLTKLQSGDIYLTHRQSSLSTTWNGIQVVALPNSADEYAQILYSALRDADQSAATRIVIDWPHGTDPEWAAIRDRLRRAAHGA